MKRTIAVVTTSRADYSHLYWPLKDLAAHPDVDLKLIVLAAHLSPDFGNTVSEIERDGFPIASRIECLLNSDTDIGMAKTLGLAILGLTDVLAQMRPDLLLLIADRYEMLAPASVALTLRIPVAHIEGGEISEGAIDDAVRNALTKMAHIHFTSTDTARAPRHQHGRRALARPSRRRALARPHHAQPVAHAGCSWNRRFKIRPQATSHRRRLPPGHAIAEHHAGGRRALRRARADRRPDPLLLSQRRRRQPHADPAHPRLYPSARPTRTSSSISTPSPTGACCTRPA